jgi:hypothetical protein
VDSAGEADASQPVDRRMALAREWDQLVEQVRAKPGFDDFLRPPPLERLLPAAADGPVAIINVSRWRCDALLVHRGDIRDVALPALTAEDVEHQVANYLDVLQDMQHRAADHAKAIRRVADGDTSPDAYEARARAAQLRREAGQYAELVLRSILGWLWKAVAQPVLTTLGFTDEPAAGAAWPRLWWCPTGPLTLLPLHAAGDYALNGPDRPTVLDRVISSYTPTLRALIEARSATAPAGDPRLLLVTVDRAGDESLLPAVAREREMLGKLFADRCTSLDGPDATIANVRAALPDHSWMHISCHANQLLDNPSRGGLRLHDGTLTIAEISRGRYHGEFAYLSACKTATGGLGLADEAITLAAALHYTGYQHVIGTLWSVLDSAAAEVALDLYDEDFRPADSAVRLHHAVRRLRDENPLVVWTPFIHIGP